MPIIEVSFLSEYEDRETGETKRVEYVLKSNQFAYIMKSQMRWGDLYRYLNAITRSTEIEE